MVLPKLQAVLLSVAALEMGNAVNGAAASDDADEEADTHEGMPTEEANEDAEEDIEADEASDEPPVAGITPVPDAADVPAPVAIDVGDLGELMREKNFVMAFGLDFVVAAAAAAAAVAACPCVMANAYVEEEATPAAKVAQLFADVRR